jgi:hypothetical protein
MDGQGVEQVEYELALADNRGRGRRVRNDPAKPAVAKL